MYFILCQYAIITIAKAQAQPSQQRGEARAVTMFHEAICITKRCAISSYVSEGKRGQYMVCLNCQCVPDCVFA